MVSLVRVSLIFTLLASAVGFYVHVPVDAPQGHRGGDPATGAAGES